MLGLLLFVIAQAHALNLFSNDILRINTQVNGTGFYRFFMDCK